MRQGGDCDDQTVLLGALASSIGFPVVVRIIGEGPGRWRHVHLRVKVRGRWVPADLTAWPRHGLGWEMRAPAERVFLLGGRELSGMEEQTFSGTLEGLGEGPFELTLGDLAAHAGSLGYSTFTLTPGGGGRMDVLGLSSSDALEGDVIGSLDGPFDFVKGLAKGAVKGLSSVAGVASGAARAVAPIVGLANPAAGASLAAGGKIAGAISGAAGGGGGAARARPPAPWAGTAAPWLSAAGAAATSKKSAVPLPRPQAIAMKIKPTASTAGGGFFQRNKLLVIGGVIVAAGVGGYFLLKKKKGRRR
jgi:hypothetical protein